MTQSGPTTVWPRRMQPGRMVALEVDIVYSGSGAHNHFQIFCGIEHCCVDNVAAHNQSVNVGNRFDEVVFCAFFKQHQLVSGLLNFFSDALYSNCCKRFFCCN